MVVHPAPGQYTGTLVNALLYKYGELAGEKFRPGIVHRLDKDTSGLMIVAKNQYFTTTDEGFVSVLIGIYENGNLLTRGKYAFTMLPDGHACGLDGFREVLKLIRTSGAVIRIVAPLYNNFEFDITTARMYVGSQVKFNQIKNEFKK